ncbi:MAG: polymorphic toxin-type HINT domain-containing protein, partial [Planctomycetota bacterium]
DNEAVMAILDGLGQELGELWTLAGSITQTVVSIRPSAILADFAAELIGTELNDPLSSSSESSIEPSDRGAAASGISVAVGRGEESAEVALAAGQEIVTRDEKLDARQKELFDKFQKLITEGLDDPGQSLSDFGIGLKDGFVDGVKNGLGGMLVDGVYYVFTDGVGDAIDAGVYVAKTGYKTVYHGLQLNPAVRYVGSWWMGYDIGANEERAVREFADKATTTTLRAAAWTKENLEYAADVLGEVQGLIKEGGDVLLNALLTGDTEQLEAILGSLHSKSSALSREALHLTRLALIEVGHAIIDMDAKQAGYIVGTIAYEAVETAVLAAIEAGLAAATVGSAGAATPATGGGTAAIVSAKAASFSKLVYRLSKKADLLDFPKIAKAIDRLNDLVVWMIKYPMCFVAGTKVHVPDGLKNIEDLRPGDLVLTRDEHDPASENRYRRVTELFRTSPKRLLTIRFQDNVDGSEEELTCTGQHPFFVAERPALSRAEVDSPVSSSRGVLPEEAWQTQVAENRTGEFIPADNLVPGDLLLLASGRESTVTSIVEWPAGDGEEFTTYNFSVQDDHTYFVGEAGVWVHNTGNPCDESFELFAKLRRQGMGHTEAYTEALRSLLKHGDEGAALIRKHAADLDNYITQAYKHALKNDYGEASDEFLELVARKKWIEPDRDVLDKELLEELRGRGMRARTPKGESLIEEHHLLPNASEFKQAFKDLDIEIDDFMIGVEKVLHRGKGVGLHSAAYKEWLGEWNGRWTKFLSDPANHDRAKVFEFAAKLTKEYGLD